MLSIIPARARVLTVVLALLFLSVACGGGGDKGSSGARNPTDPRRVPTATVPAQLPTPIAALTVNQPGTPTAPETYVVQPGDTLGGIATALKISQDDLTRANPGVTAANLRAGQELKVARPTPAPSGAARAPATPAASATPARSATPGAASPTPARSSTPAASASAAPSRTAAPAATNAPAATSAAAAGGPYTVVAGDTACGIAKKLGVSLAALARENGVSIDALAALRVGQTLQTPRSTGESAGC